MYNQEEKQELYPTDFFQLTKSYDEILADHDLIKKMKLTLQQAGMRQYAENCSFEELIKEAYFQCGIILRRSICPYYGDYIDLFIDRERRCFKKYDTINKRTVACMVHLLLSTRKRNPDGVAEIVDCIKNICDIRDDGSLPPNPFEKLLYSGKYKHNIDFGVHAKPLCCFVWENVNWFDFGLEDPRYESWLDDPDWYCTELEQVIGEVMECLDFQNEYDQLEALDRIEKWMYNDEECTNKKCEFYNGSPYKCTCEDKHFFEPPYFNRLRKKVIDNMKQAVMEKYGMRPKETVPSKNEFVSKVFLNTKKGRRVDMIRIIDVLYELNFFTEENGTTRCLKKDVYDAFGKILNLDFDNYDKDLTNGKHASENKQTNIFKEMLRKKEDMIDQE